MMEWSLSGPIHCRQLRVSKQIFCKKYSTALPVLGRELVYIVLYVYWPEPYGEDCSPGPAQEITREDTVLVAPCRSQDTRPLRLHAAQQRSFIDIHQGRRRPVSAGGNVQRSQDRAYSGSILISGSPFCTTSPFSATRATTRPATSDWISLKTFIASMRATT